MRSHLVTVAVVVMLGLCVLDNVVNGDPTGMLIAGRCGLGRNVITETATSIDNRSGSLFQLAANVCWLNATCP